MRIAFFSPLNPKRSGISDYAEALLSRLAQHLEIEVFIEDYAPSNSEIARTFPIRHWREFEPEHARGHYDAVLYHMGNNPFHVYIYDLAVRIPGVVVLHDFNLHYLLADATIVRGNWPAYFEELESNAGPQALAHARRAQAGEVGLEYDRIPMNRRLLERSRAVIVHSDYTARLVRDSGFTLPLKKIPHGGAVFPPSAMPDAQAARRRLEIDSKPLFGVFGFLKPYKRVTSVIQAFARLSRYRPEARLILVGEEHPHYPLRPLIRDLGQEERIRLLGYVPLDQFVEHIAACDVCLSLRYPTVGESSGSLLREMALGRAVIVSDIGPFSELPDNACIKIPAGEGEQEWLFEYMNTLVNRPDLARAIGENAADYVERECAWEKVAAEYAAFLEEIGRPPPRPESHPKTPQPDVGAYILSFSRHTKGSEDYVRTHLRRMVRTLEITPPGGPGKSVLELGCYLQMTPALKRFLSYEEVRGAYYGPAGQTDSKVVRSSDGQEFGCEIDLFDAEKDAYPYPDACFDTVLCCELVEHLYFDPMHMMAEINRVLKPGGHVVLTTPNITSLRALDAALSGYHPGLFHVYVKPDAHGVIDPRHNREYAPRDVVTLFSSAGFEVVRLETGWYSTFSTEEEARHAGVAALLGQRGYPNDLRGDIIYAVGRKTGPVKERWPAALYYPG